MEERYYLAYGSNLNKKQMSERCTTATVIGCSTLLDYYLLFKKSCSGSYLTVEKQEGSIVPLGVWKVSKEEEALLDRREGCPTWYYKKEIDVVLKETGKTIHGFIYILHETQPCGIPEENYVNRCRKGYEDFGFDEAILDKAVDDSKKGVH